MTNDGAWSCRIPVFTISGLDGSGKSTQAQRLIERLTAAGGRVYYFHAIQFSLANRISAFSASAPGKKAAVTRASSLGILLRKIVLLIDVERYRRLLWKLIRKGYTAVVSDRYFYDTVVNIAYLERTSKLLRVTLPGPTHAFYLRLDPRLIMSRERAPEQGLEYLIAKTSLYDAAASHFDLTSIDGAGDPDAVAHEIDAALGSGRGRGTSGSRT